MYSKLRNFDNIWNKFNSIYLQVGQTFKRYFYSLFGSFKINKLGRNLKNVNFDQAFGL